MGVRHGVRVCRHSGVAERHQCRAGAQRGRRARSSGVVMALGRAAASGRQRRSERERAHSSALRARRQRREEEGGERKGTLVNDFDSIQNQNFQLKLEKH